MATVTRLEKHRYLVTGVIAVIRGRIVNEPYARVFVRKARAVDDASYLDRLNVAALAELEEQTAARKADVETYLAKRAARPACAQISFTF